MPKRKSEDVVDLTMDSLPKKGKKARVIKDPASTPQQRAAVSEFTSVTQADKTTASKLLKQHNWNVGAAVNAFFNNPSSGANPLAAPLKKLFDKYREDPKNAPDEINIEGTSNLLGELQIELSDVGALVFSELVQSPSLGVITRDGFVDGWSDVGVDTLPKMRNIILQRRSQLPTDRNLFRNVYNHTFQLALQDRQKALPMEMATEFWRLLFQAPAWEWKTKNSPWLDWWIEFCEGKIKKAVNKDLWKQTLTFAEETIKDETLGFWSEESSWPSVIDEFVEWVKEEKGVGKGDAMEIS